MAFSVLSPAKFLVNFFWEASTHTNEFKKAIKKPFEVILLKLRVIYFGLQLLDYTSHSTQCGSSAAAVSMVLPGGQSWQVEIDDYVILGTAAVEQPRDDEAMFK